jgi:hypothetical protein
MLDLSNLPLAWASHSHHSPASKPVNVATAFPSPRPLGPSCGHYRIPSKRYLLLAQNTTNSFSGRSSTTVKDYLLFSMKGATCSLRTDVLRIIHIAFCSQTNNVLEEMPPSSVETSLSTKGFLDYPVVLDFVLAGAYAFLPFVREGNLRPILRNGWIYCHLPLCFKSHPSTTLGTQSVG